MQYLIRVEKSVDCLPEPVGSGPRVRCPKLVYVNGVSDLRPESISDQDRREVLEEAIESHGVALDPKWPLESAEQVHAVPNVQIGPKKRRYGEAVYKGEITIPDELVDKHMERHRRYRRQ